MPTLSPSPCVTCWHLTGRCCCYTLESGGRSRANHRGRLQPGALASSLHTAACKPASCSCRSPSWFCCFKTSRDSSASSCRVAASSCCSCCCMAAGPVMLLPDALVDGCVCSPAARPAVGEWARDGNEQCAPHARPRHQVQGQTKLDTARAACIPETTRAKSASCCRQPHPQLTLLVLLQVLQAQCCAAGCGAAQARSRSPRGYWPPAACCLLLRLPLRQRRLHRLRQALHYCPSC